MLFAHTLKMYQSSTTLFKTKHDIPYSSKLQDRARRASRFQALNLSSTFLEDKGFKSERDVDHSSDHKVSDFVPSHVFDLREASPPTSTSSSRSTTPELELRILPINFEAKLHHHKLQFSNKEEVSSFSMLLNAWSLTCTPLHTSQVVLWPPSPRLNHITPSALTPRSPTWSVTTSTSPRSELDDVELRRSEVRASALDDDEPCQVRAIS